MRIFTSEFWIDLKRIFFGSLILIVIVASGNMIINRISSQYDQRYRIEVIDKNGVVVTRTFDGDVSIDGDEIHLNNRQGMERISVVGKTFRIFKVK